jgi:hypothetical protein
MPEEPKVTQKKRLQLLGRTYYGNPFHSAKEWNTENEIGKLLKRFENLPGK